MKKDHKKTPVSHSENTFPVIGVGASAGGLDAFKKLVKAIPAGSGMAFILVQHLHPEVESALPEILQRETLTPVVEISDNIKVEPDHIYVIPSNKILTATDGILKLKPREPKGTLNMPINIFFSSLAEVHQSRSIGIILSGTGTDGTAGLKDIKNHGGYTFAQSIDTAGYDGMPQHAIDAEVIDFTLPPESIPAKLQQLFGSFIGSPPGDQWLLKDGTSEETFRQILGLIRTRLGVDFNFYKQTTVRRRIVRRMVILHLNTLTEYLDYLKNNNTELDIVFQDLLIPVTAFFRDVATFDVLCSDIIPEMIQNKSVAGPLRIWVAGCSTGQEAYSIAMCVYENVTRHSPDLKVQIFATDISAKSIDKARMGVYTKKELDGLTETQLHQFFNKFNGTYQVKKIVKDMCIFAVQNFLKDPPFAKMDLISCRNVLIYFEPFLQRKALTIFHYALNEKGTLWLGKSETPSHTSDLFVHSGKDKFFKRKPGQGRFMNVASSGSELAFSEANYSLRGKEGKKDNFQKSADDILLSRYAPAGVVIDGQFDIVQFRGATTEFLEPAQGIASFNVLKMAKGVLSFELRNALHQVRSTKAPFIRQGISLNGTLVTIEVIPLLDMADIHYLVLFRKEEREPEKNAKGNKPFSGSTPKKGNIKNKKDVRILQLEEELAQAREDMRNITENQEAANEELESSNEELLSGSEELQSLNEELETSKEELQSTNEELITINQELYDMNEQLSQLKIFAETTLSTLHEPLLVLDQEFKITSANKSFYKTFRLTEDKTLGKVLFELQEKTWEIPGLKEELIKIKHEKESSIEKEITFAFQELGIRTICFNIQPIKRESGEHLILLALDDITERKILSTALNEQLLERKHDQLNLRLILQSIPQITITLSAKGKVNFFNNYFLEYSGLTFDEATTGGGWKYLIHPEDLEDFSYKAGDCLKTGEEFYKEVRLKRNSDGLYRWHICRATAIRDKDDKIILWVGLANDIHDQKLKEQKKDEFISIASHEMKTPLTTAKAYLQLLEQVINPANSEALLYAAKGSQAVERLNVLITELLDVSKIQYGKLDYKITTFDFNKAIDESIEVIHHTSPTYLIIKKGTITRDVKGDKERLQQVLINLLSNAIKYSPKNHNISIDVENDANTFTVAVKDKGIGIQKSHLDKIFDRYFRVENDTSNFQGLGIGLFICSEIIKRHGGRIWVESEFGKGSTFYFTLPFNL